MFHSIQNRVVYTKRIKKLDNRVLHPVMYLSTKSGISFQTTWAFAVSIAPSLSVTYLNVASNYEQHSKKELKRINLSFV